MPEERKKIAILVASLRIGGAEQAMVNLANGFQEKNFETSLLTIENKHDLKARLNNGVRLHHLDKKRTRYSFLALRKWINRESPDVLIVSQSHVQLVAILAIRTTNWKGKLILNEQSTFSSNTKKPLTVFLASILFKRADAVTIVSNGASKDFVNRFPQIKENVTVIPNPVFREEILILKDENISHDFFKEKDIPVILAVGRLSPEKNFKFLLKVFQVLLRKKEARLLILGDGIERKELLKLALELGVALKVSIPGMVANPYPYMKQCDVFVLTSIYEGLPSVLIEALACGCNIVSTNCPNGPSEILNNEEFGKLVSTSDVSEFADAIINQMGVARNEVAKLNHAKSYSIEAVITQYMHLFNRLS